jgi:hypothetical protein
MNQLYNFEVLINMDILDLSVGLYLVTMATVPWALQALVQSVQHGFHDEQLKICAKFARCAAYACYGDAGLVLSWRRPYQPKGKSIQRKLFD